MPSSQSDSSDFQYIVFRDFVIIPLTKGRHTLIDREDLPKVTKYKWCYNGRYAARGTTITERGERRGKVFTMHRIIMGDPYEKEIDHINGDCLDNRKANLRICTHKQNMANGKKRSMGMTASDLKGVYWNKLLGKWYSTISIEGKSKYLGLFSTQEDAAKAYDKAAKSVFGDFARTNF